MNTYSQYEAQTERTYHDAQESAAIAEIISACAKAIFDSQDAATMKQLQLHAYKYTECGPAVSFELHEVACGYEDDAIEAPIGLETPRKSPFVYVGDDRAESITEPWLSICKIGVSSIVEGSDAEIPIQWLDLEQFADSERYEGDLPELCKNAVAAFGRIVEYVNDEACALWHEANDGDDDNVIA
jgi:hypothetical protein